MKFRLIPALILGISLSIATSKIVYFGFNTNNTVNVFAGPSFNGIFEQTVFKYRVLSKYLFLNLADWLEVHKPALGKNERLIALRKSDSPRFYYAYYYLNTFFLILSSILTVLILNTKRALMLQGAEKYFILFTAITTISLSQFVIFPYDISSYFFQLMILYIFFEMIDRDYWFTMLAICALLFLSTLNRESASLSVSLLSVLLIHKWGITKKTIIGISLLLIGFIGTYISIRYAIPSPGGKMYTHDMVPHPLTGINLIGLFIWILLLFFSLVIANTSLNSYAILIFHVLSLPYIFMCLKYGNAWEVRLYIPLFLSSLFLAKLDVTDSRIKGLWLFPKQLMQNKLGKSV